MDGKRKSGDKPVRDAEREARLARALRQNLRRRKDQAKRRKGESGPEPRPEEPRNK